MRSRWDTSNQLADEQCSVLASLPEQLTCQAQRWVARMPPPVSTLAADPGLPGLGYVRRAPHLAAADSSPQLVAVPALRMRQKVLQLHVLQSTATLQALVGGCMPRLVVQEHVRVCSASLRQGRCSRCRRCLSGRCRRRHGGRPWSRRRWRGGRLGRRRSRHSCWRLCGRCRCRRKRWCLCCRSRCPSGRGRRRCHSRRLKWVGLFGCRGYA